MDPWTYWKDVINAPKLILAPMVDHSELPWRMLSREYGCHAAYTPMFHAANFSSAKYRQRNFTTCPQDRPLFVQFCANNSDTLLRAAKHVEHCCDGIDLNLGCPQQIAKRGHYGAFLQDEWDLISEMVKKLRANISNKVAISCKIRRLETLEQTVEYAKMLERSGCTFIGIHGRTREQRGVRTGVADWNHIKAVKEAVKIPVIANGNVQSLRDAEDCLEYTGADAVMTAEGNLYNPGLFQNIHPPAWEVARKYLDYVEKYPVPVGMAKAHLFKLFHRCIAIEENRDLLIKLGKSSSLQDLHLAVDYLRSKYFTPNCDQAVAITVQPVPPYLCQPRFRYSAESSCEQSIDGKGAAEQEIPCDNECQDSSKKKIKLV